jgi:DNA-binding Lrp family transcriptional regulator
VKEEVMSGKGDISLLIEAAVAGRTLPEVAAVTGVSVSTVHRRLKEPDVSVAIRDARAQQRQERLGRLSGLSVRALTRPAELLDHDNPMVVLKAVGLTLGTAIRLDPIVDLEERLTAVAAAAAELRSAEEDEA